MLVKLEDVIVGCVHVKCIDKTTSMFGMLVAHPDYRNQGIGKKLLIAVEDWCKNQGYKKVCLELLTPKDWVHEQKEFLKSWYVRSGYIKQSTVPFNHAEHLLTPCDLTLYCKDLIKTEFNLETEERLKGILEELIKREPIFHHPEYGTKRIDFENMTVEDFWEVGASGNRYSREEVINTLIDRYADPTYKDIWETKEFHCREIAKDNYLVTYTLLQEERVTRRATLWRWSGKEWKIVYHQGTLV